MTNWQRVRQCGHMDGPYRPWRRTWSTRVSEGNCSQCVGQWPKFRTGSYDHGRSEEFEPHTLADHLRFAFYTYARTHGCGETQGEWLEWADAAAVRASEVAMER